MFRHLKVVLREFIVPCALCPADVAVSARPRQQRLHIQPLRKPFITLYNQYFIEVYRFIF